MTMTVPRFETKVLLTEKKTVVASRKTVTITDHATDKIAITVNLFDDGSENEALAKAIIVAIEDYLSDENGEN